MTVAYVNNAAAASGTTTAAVTQPASPVSGNIYIAHIGCKPFGSVPTPPANYQQMCNAAAGAVANGLDTGSVRATAFQHRVTGSESGTVTFSVTSGSPTIGKMQQYSKDSAKVWDLVSCVLADTTETGTAVSATPAGSLIMDVKAGDMLSIAVIIKSDTVTHTSQALAITGCTLGAITWDTVDVTTSGNQAALYVGRCNVTAGAATNVPTYTATSSLSGASACAVSVVRLRESDAGAVVFDVSGSSVSNTMSLGAKTVFSVACWIQLSFQPATFHGCWQIKNSGGTDYAALATTSAGNAMQVWNETGNLNGLGLDLLWVYVCIVVNAGTDNLYWALDTSSSLTTVALAAVGSTPFDVVAVGYGEGVGDYFRGRVCGVKAWDAALSAGEALTEKSQKAAVRTANLLFSWPLEGTADLNDVSGNGRHLTGGTGAFSTGGPNVSRGSLGGAVTLPPAATIVKQAVNRSYTY